MDRGQKTLLTRVFEALGPERVADGLQARGRGWTECFVARAASASLLGPLPTATSIMATGQLYGRALGMAPGWIFQVARLWDREEGEFRTLANEWLERREPSAKPLARSRTA